MSGSKDAKLPLRRRRTFHKNLRGEKKAPLPVPDEWLQTANEYDDANSYYNSNEKNEDWIDVASVISRLRGREAEIVSALFFEGKKPKEVAQEKKLDVSHVYRLRRAAINKIRGWLFEYN